MANDPLDQRYGDLLDQDPCVVERSRANGAIEDMGRQFVAGVVVGGSATLAGALLFVLARRTRLMRVATLGR